MVNKSSVSLLFYLCSGSLCSAQIMNCSSSGSRPVFFFLVSLLTCWSSLPNKWAAPLCFGCCRGKMQMSVPAVSVGPRLRGRAEVSSESWLCFLSAAARSSHCGVMTLRESTKNQKEPHPNGSLCELETHTHTHTQLQSRLLQRLSQWKNTSSLLNHSSHIFEWSWCFCHSCARNALYRIWGHAKQSFVLVSWGSREMLDGCQKLLDYIHCDF